jgi:hypothetical protein
VAVVGKYAIVRAQAQTPPVANWCLGVAHHDGPCRSPTRLRA